MGKTLPRYQDWQSGSGGEVGIRGNVPARSHVIVQLLSTDEMIGVQCKVSEQWEVILLRQVDHELHSIPGDPPCVLGVCRSDWFRILQMRAMLRQDG